MKIAVWHNLPSGGGKRALYHFVQGLVERGHDVVAWCPPSADQSYLPLSRLITEHIKPCQPILWQPKPSRAPLAWFYAHYQNTKKKIGAMDEHCRLCAREIGDGQFDILFGNICMYMGVSSIARHIDMPSLLYLQEPSRFLYEALPTLPWLAFHLPGVSRLSLRYIKGFLQDTAKVQGYRWQAREEVTNADAYTTILVNSLFSRESILRAYGLSAEVSYLGVDTSLFNWQNLTREHFIIGLGSVTPAKNIRFVIESLSKVPETMRPPLIWVGNMAFAYHATELMKFAESRKVKFEIKVAVEDSELVDLLNRATMMVYAPRLEPFGLAPLEANACGLPVVAVAEGGVRESVIHEANGLLVNADPEEMAEAIMRLLLDRDLAESLGRSGIRLVMERWSIESAVDRVESKLMKTMQKSTPTESTGQHC